MLSEAGAIRARAPATGRLGFAGRGGVSERKCGVCAGASFRPFRSLLREKSVAVSGCAPQNRPAWWSGPAKPQQEKTRRRVDEDSADEDRVITTLAATRGILWAWDSLSGGVCCPCRRSALRKNADVHFHGSFSPVFAETTFGGVVRGVVGIGEAWAVTSYVRATTLARSSLCAT